MREHEHGAEVVIGVTPEVVWDAIVNPEMTRRYVYAADIEGDWRPGGSWRYHSGGRSYLEGTVEEIEPPRHLRLSGREVFAEPGPLHFMTWDVEALPEGGSRVRLSRDGSDTFTHAEDLEGIVAGLRAVLDPEVAASLRRLDEIGPVEVRPLTPDRRDDFLDLFDNRAFADNPSWGGCYCYNHRYGGDVERRKAENRADMGADIAGGRAHGLLAYADGRAVGWCSASPKTEMPGLMRRDWMPRETDRVGVIGCLVISSQYRRHGIARELVVAASDYLASLGCTVVEAYPLPETHSEAHGFMGPRELFQELGYEVYRDSRPRMVLRKRLDV
jgi:uncharacterized protein YndB with AHSA1/START domain/GNAT superfamily N-acetyltransferase